jgi:hypothetical protein
MKKIIASILACIIMAVGFVGCNTSDVLTSVVQKTYSLTLTAQNVVTTANATNMATIATVLNVSLGVVDSALAYVTPKVTSQKVLDAIAKARASIVTVRTALTNLTPATLEQTRQTILASIDVMKSTVVSVADYFKIPLPVTMKASTGDPIKDLKDANDALSEIRNKK